MSFDGYVIVTLAVAAMVVTAALIWLLGGGPQ